jgi:outer membrane protein assembly factor BamB
LSRYCRSCGQELGAGAEWRLARGSAGGSGYLKLPLRFQPNLTPVTPNLRLDRKITGQPVHGFGHLCFPVEGGEVVVVRESDLRQVAVCKSTSTEVHEIGLAGDSLLMAGNKGLESVELLPLLTRGIAQTAVIYPTPIIWGRAQTLTVLPDLGQVVVIGETTVAAVGPKGGKPIWSAQRPGRGGAAIIKAGQGVLVVEESGDYWSVDPVSGTRRWHRQMGRTIAMRAGISSWDHLVYLLDSDGLLTLVQADRGGNYPTAHRFTRPYGIACNGRHVYVSSFLGLHRCSPMEAAGMQIGDHPLYSPAVITQGAVFVGTGHGALMMADQGSERHQFKAGVQGEVVTTPVVTGRGVYVGSETGEVALFRFAQDGGTV